MRISGGGERMDMVWTAGLSAGLAIAGGMLAHWIWRALAGLHPDRMPRAVYPPPALDLPTFSGVRAHDFVSSNDQGAFGEALTALMMASQGWTVLNGKPGAGPQGIDGIFVRSEGSLWRACLIETKTNQSQYATRQMERSKLMGNLDSLYVTNSDPALAALYEAIHDGLRGNAPWVSLALWRHHLGSGLTQITPLDGTGAVAGRSRTVTSGLIMQGLAAGVSELDRKRVYWTGGSSQPSDPSSPEHP